MKYGGREGSGVNEEETPKTLSTPKIQLAPKKPQKTQKPRESERERRQQRVTVGTMVLRCWGWLQDEQPTSLPEAAEQPAAEKDGDEL